MRETVPTASRWRAGRGTTPARPSAVQVMCWTAPGYYSAVTMEDVYHRALLTGPEGQNCRRSPYTRVRTNGYSGLLCRH